MLTTLKKMLGLTNKRPSNQNRPCLLFAERMEDRITPAYINSDGFMLGGVTSVNKSIYDSQGNQYISGNYVGLPSMQFDDGTYVPLGNYNSGAYENFFLAKLGPKNDLLWSRNFGSLGSNDNIHAIELDQSGNIYAVGKFTGTVDFDPGPNTAAFTSLGFSDGYILKLNTQGEYIWCTRLQGNLSNSVTNIALDKIGRPHVLGETSGANWIAPNGALAPSITYGGNDIVIAKLDTFGNVIYSGNIGGASTDTPISLHIDKHSYTWITGLYSGTADVDPGFTTHQQFTTFTTTFITKLDPLMRFQFGFSIEGDALNRRYRTSIDSQGNFYVAGQVYSETYLYSSDYNFKKLVRSSNAAYDSYVAQYNHDGILQWHRQYGGEEYGAANLIDSIHIHGSQLTIAGQLTYDTDFNPGTHEHVFMSRNEYSDIYLLQLTTMGEYINCSIHGSDGFDGSNFITIDRNNVITISGYVGEDSTFLGTPIYSFAYSSFLLKLRPSTDLLARSHTGGWFVARNLGTSFSSRTFMGTWNEAANWRDVIQGDFDGNGRMDVLGRTSSGDWWLAAQTSNGLFQNKYWGKWNESVGWRDVLTADFNGDGILDVAGRTSAGEWWIGLSTPTGLLNQLWDLWNESAGWPTVAVADLDGDGRMDIIGRTNAGEWWGAFNLGGGFVHRKIGQWNPAANWSDVKITDMNSDGRPDVIGRTSAGEWWVGSFTGTTLTFQKWGQWNNAVAWQTVLIADFNGDGRPDVAGGTSGGVWYITMNTGSSGNQNYLWSNSPLWMNAFALTDFQAVDLNGDGRADIIGRAGGQWYVGLSNASGLGQTPTIWANFGTSDWRDSQYAAYVM